MESNNATLAPQTDDADTLFQTWRRNHVGNKNDFFAFMTTPSSDRDRFLATVTVNGGLAGRLITNNVTTTP